jgi:LmbE family N-acetylglucosaminyl deacetylase
MQRIGYLVVEGHDPDALTTGARGAHADHIRCVEAVGVAQLR